ncbi:MAG: hypothetical protein KA479_07420 [Saprospiraceae bacterium]|nr:hypothetical protein [Saprospiraceae bacterium]
MHTIIQELNEQFPGIFSATQSTDRYAVYKALHDIGNYCAQHFEEAETQEILNTINRMYLRENLFTCNAIENEFLATLAAQLDMSDLTKHLKRIPENLWAVYIHVLIDKQKNNKL